MSNVILMKLHVIAGLPRSGSTLLSGILKQNPRVHADISSPLHKLVNDCLLSMNDKETPENRVFFKEEEHRLSVIKGLIDGYLQFHGKEIYFDTNRFWSRQRLLLHKIYPDAKIFLVLRNVAEIVNSLEAQIIRNPTHLPGWLREIALLPQADRIRHYLSKGSFFWLSMEYTKDILLEKPQNVTVIQYRQLVTDPRKIIKAIYSEIGEEVFDHDYSNVEFEREEYDTLIGAPGLHSVRGPVENRPVKWVIGQREIVELQKLTIVNS